MYNASVEVEVKTVEPNKRIEVEWSGYGAPTASPTACRRAETNLRGDSGA